MKISLYFAEVNSVFGTGEVLQLNLILHGSSIVYLKTSNLYAFDPPLAVFLSLVQDSFIVAVHYLGQEVLKRQIHGNDIRITYLPSSLVPPTADVLKGGFPRIPLPEPTSELPAGPERQALFTLLPFMEKGVVLTSTPQGVYGKRFCQGRVFWTRPHTNTPGMHKMERNNEPVLLFSKDVFKQRE